MIIFLIFQIAFLIWVQVKLVSTEPEFITYYLKLRHITALDVQFYN